MGNRKHKSSPKWVTERLSNIILIEYSLFDLTVLNHEIIVLVTFFYLSLLLFVQICDSIWNWDQTLGFFSFSYFLVIKYIDTWINLSMYVYVTHSHVLYMHMKVCVYTYTSMHVRIYVCADVRKTRRAPEVAACAWEALTTGHPWSELLRKGFELGERQALQRCFLCHRLPVIIIHN